MTDATNPDAMERDIESTRREINRTIDAIRLRTSRSRLVDQAVEFVKENGQDFARNGVRSVAANPLPVALISSGIAWMLLREARPSNGGTGRALVPVDSPANVDAELGYDPMTLEDSESRSRASLYVRARDATAGLTRAADETAESFRHRYAAAQAEVLGIERKAEEQLDDFRQRVDSAFREAGDAARAAGEKLANAAHDAGARARRAREHAAHAMQDGAAATSDAMHAASSAARSGANRVGDTAARLFEEQPLLAGALGIAAGALLGALLPSTREEDELMGETGDRLRSTARQTVEDAATTVVESGEAVAKAGVDAAKNEGADSEGIKRALRETEHAAERVADAAKHEAEDQMAKVGSEHG